MSANPAYIEPDLDLLEEIKEQPAYDGTPRLLGAHVGGGDPRIPLLRDYVLNRMARGRDGRQPASVAVPAACHRSFYGWNYGMLANDQLGDCVIAAKYHARMHILHVLGEPVPDPEQLTPLVVETYGEDAGYVPGDPSTDNGTNPATAWQNWVANGIPWTDGTRHRMDALAQILPHDGVNLRRAIYEFDCVGLSLAMPIAWQGAGHVWDAGGDPNDPAWQPGGWGGHEVLGVSYDRNYIAIITWGGVKLLTWRAWGTYGELALAQIGTDDIASAKGVSETGIDLEALATDFQSL